MITLDNYPKLGSYILISDNSYRIFEDKDQHKLVQGVGGFSENGELVGVYVKEGKLFFFYNGHSFEAPIDALSCTNHYVSKVERCFDVTISGQEVCRIVYEPFIDPGMIYYDADPEEFDALLYMSRLLKDKESMKSFVNGIERPNQ